MGPFYILCTHFKECSASIKMAKLPKVVVFGVGLTTERFADKDYTVLSCHESDVKVADVIQSERPDILVSIGSSTGVFPELCTLPLWQRKAWLHFESFEKINDGAVLNCYIINVLVPSKELVSIFTTTYKSKTKILRPFRSLRAQTYQDWEWVILDDSDDNGETYRMLEALKEKEPRIRLYKPQSHSGYIGAVKRDTAMMCRGKYIVELDHDDDILPETLQLLVNAFKTDPKIGFVYSDFCELFDDNLQNWKYVETYGLGYGSYMKSLVQGRWVNHAPTPPANPKTFSHIVGVPNHIRSWRAETYREIGGHNAGLWVADDYELILRTFCAGWKLCRIPLCLYLQYRNRVDNNFTFMRNKEIQKLTRLISMQYQNILQKTFRDLGFTDYNYEGTVKIWEVENDDLMKKQLTKKAEVIYVPDGERVAIVLTSVGNQSHLKGAIQSVMSQSYTNWELYIIGHQAEELDKIMESDEFKKAQIHWWNLESKHSDLSVLRNYALIQLVVAPHVAYLESHKRWAPNHLEVLMKAMKPDLSFVEGSSGKQLSASCLLHRTS